MNKKLFEQAKRNVEQEIAEDKKERVKEEYKRIKHDSEKRKATKKELKQIRELYKKSKLIKPSNWVNSIQIKQFVVSVIEDYVKTGWYHPKDLKDLEEYVNSK